MKMISGCKHKNPPPIGDGFFIAIDQRTFTSNIQYIFLQSIKVLFFNHIGYTINDI